MPDTNGLNGGSQKMILIALVAVAAVGVSGAAFASEVSTATQIFGFCSLICVSLLGFLQNIRASMIAKAAVEKTTEKIDATTAKVEEVNAKVIVSAMKTDAKLVEIVKVGEATHTLVNSAMSIQLRATAAALRHVAELTKSKADKEAATLAEGAAKEHDDKQHIVDSGDAVKVKP